MDVVSEYLSKHSTTVGVGIGVVGVSALLYRVVGTRKRQERICGVDYPGNTVILHQFTRGKFAPSLSHFVMKLETYLKITKIPYQSMYSVESVAIGPKSKIPWIEYNGVTMGDSQLIINFLNEKFNVNLNKGLSKEQRAVAWAIQKWIEEFTYHLNMQTRWVILPDDLMTPFSPGVPQGVMNSFHQHFRKAEYITGIGRHTDNEVFDMSLFDLRQLSVILGDKKFLMGGDEPTEVDCAVFGILSQIRWHTPDECPGKHILRGELHNLMAYLDRIKQTYWPDWDDLLYDTAKA